MSTSIDTVPAAPEAAPQAIVYPPAYRSLMTVGLMGYTFGRREDADIVNAAIEMTLDNSLVYRLHRAIALGIGGHGEAAQQLLQDDIDNGQRPEAAKVALAVAKIASDDDSWTPLIESVLASGEDPEARQVAADLVSYLLSLNPNP
jgi:hypothetical protein